MEVLKNLTRPVKQGTTAGTPSNNSSGRSTTRRCPSHRIFPKSSQSTTGESGSLLRNLLILMDHRLLRQWIQLLPFETPLQLIPRKLRVGRHCFSIRDAQRVSGYHRKSRDLVVAEHVSPSAAVQRKPGPIADPQKAVPVRNLREKTCVNHASNDGPRVNSRTTSRVADADTVAPPQVTVQVRGQMSQQFFPQVATMSAQPVPPVGAPLQGRQSLDNGTLVRQGSPPRILQDSHRML